MTSTSAESPSLSAPGAFLNPLLVVGVVGFGYGVRWSRLSEQIFRVDKWSVCRG
jgi:hypothetical protein